jgi:protein-arginine kinase activator protein McsA
MNLMYCTKCKSGKDLMVITTTRLISGEIKNYYTCRPCNTKRHQAYRQKPEGKAAVSAASKKYDTKNPHRRKAWNAAKQVHKPQPCVVCGETKVDRHHPDITKQTEIVFLCRVHHKLAHRIADSVLK